MFALGESNEFLLYTSGVDLRKGINGLDGFIRHYSYNSLDGSVYIFINRTRNTLKLLHWERGGFVIYNKRLERGRISHKVFTDDHAKFKPIRWDELVLLMEGLIQIQDVAIGLI